MKKREIDFTEGGLLKKIIIFALPIIGVNVLQLLFSAADVAVLGIFTNDQAVAAVGATAQIVNLMVGFFVGLSVGANVLVARAAGAKDEERAHRLVGTSVCISVVFGIFIMIAGIFLTEKFLIWTNCDATVLPYASKYLRIYFLGMPIIMLYNFSAAILRAVGDTLRPLMFLAASGVANVFLNIFFIVVVGFDVEGVAIATVVSQAVSAVGALILMIRSDGYAKLGRQYFKIHKKELGDIFYIGLPMGLSKCSFALSNVILYSSINALGDLVMAANSIAKEFDGFILETLHGFSLACLAVISQNLGAKKPERIKKTIYLSMLLCIFVGIVLSVLLYIFGAELCGIMTDTELVIEYCMIRVIFVGVPYFILGAVNVVQESIRGLGYSTTSLVISIFSNIAFRLFWIWCVYPSLAVDGDNAYNYAMICVVWPISWIITMFIATGILIYLYQRVKNKINKEINIKNMEKIYVKS